MAIVVEDGTGKPDAESYIDRTFLNTFSAEWGLGDLTEVNTTVAEGAMRRATLMFDVVYGPRFTGVPVSGAQALVFPMTGLIDRRSFEVPVFPIQIQQATAVLARHEVQSPMSLFPTITPAKAKKSFTADRVSVEFDLTAGGAGYVEGARPILSMVEGILHSLGIVSRTGNLLQGSVVRG